MNLKRSSCSKTERILVELDHEFIQRSWSMILEFEIVEHFAFTPRQLARYLQTLPRCGWKENRKRRSGHKSQTPDALENLLAYVEQDIQFVKPSGYEHDIQKPGPKSIETQK